MYAEERQQEILRIARDEGRVEVAGLADGSTSRRRRSAATSPRWSGPGCCAGCTAGPSPSSGSASSPRSPPATRCSIDEKERIAKAGLAEVREEGAIILDAGTTTAGWPQLLPGRPRAHRRGQLAGRSPRRSAPAPTSQVLLLGRPRPRHDPRHRRRLGAAAARRPVRRRRLHRHQRHLGRARPDDPGPGRGGGQARDDRAPPAARSCSPTHTKVGNDYFARFGSLADVDLLITDTGLDADLADDVRAAGPRGGARMIVTADPQPQPRPHRRGRRAGPRRGASAPPSARLDPGGKGVNVTRALLRQRRAVA